MNVKRYSRRRNVLLCVYTLGFITANVSANVLMTEENTSPATCPSPLPSLFCPTSSLPSTPTPPDEESTLGVTVDDSEGKGENSDCILRPDGSCNSFEHLLAGVLGNINKEALDQILNGTDLGLDLHGTGRQNPNPLDNPSPWDVINILQRDRNRTSLTQEVVENLDVQNLTHNDAKDLLNAVYDVLVADNSTEEGLDDRVASLLFKIAHVDSIDEGMLTVFGKSTALIITGEEDKNSEKKEIKESQAVMVLETMERVLAITNATQHEQQLKELELRVREVDMTSLQDDDVTLDSRVGDKKNTVCLSRSLFPLQRGKVSTVIYSSIHDQLPSNRQGSLRGGQVASHVVSVVVDNGMDCGPHAHWCVTDGSYGYLDFTVNFTVPFVQSEDVEDRVKRGTRERRFCVHWKFKLGAWSDDGCWLLDSNQTHTTCTCNHLSTFAVLVTFTKNGELSEEHVKVMFVLTAIGCSLSIAGLAITICTYIYLRILHRERILIHANLALALLLAQVLFIASDQAHKHQIVCKVVAALLHFLFLASFSWMLVEGVALYRTCTRGLLYSADMRLRYSLLGWGIPLVIVVISLGMEFQNYGQGLQNSCWLSVEEGLIWAFMGPMLIVVSLNVLILCLVIRVFLTLRANSQKSDVARARAGVRAMAMLLPLLGTTWLLSLLVPLSAVFGYLFILCNSLQGLLIFALHCLSNEEVRRFLASRRSTIRSRTSESNLSVVGWRRRSPALTFDDLRQGLSGRSHRGHTEGRASAWV